MAFGKDQTNLSRIPSFGQATLGQRSSTTGKSRGRRGGGKPYWLNNFQISTDPALPTRFRIIKGDYVQQYDVDGELYQDSFPYFMFREHFHGTTSKGAICSAGPKYMSREERQRCLGCELYWDEYALRRADKDSGGDGKKPRTISMTDKYAFTVFDYSYYFQMPDTDNSGQYRIDPKTKQPYTTWVQAPNPQDPQFQGFPWKEGDLRPWAISTQWKETLVGRSVQIGMSCASCGSQNSIHSRGWYCGNVHCHQFIVDPNNAAMTAEQLKTLTKNPYGCPTCQQTFFPVEDVACAGCAAGRRASVWDVDLWGYKQESDGPPVLVITGVSAPGPMMTQDPTALKDVKPLDLSKVFSASSVEHQSKIWNITPSSGQIPQMGMPQHQMHPQMTQQPQWSGAPQQQQQQAPMPAAPAPSHVYQQQPVQQPYPQQNWGNPQSPQQQYVDPAQLHAQLGNIPKPQ